MEFITTSGIITINGNEPNESDSSVQGVFYGNEAQAIGGTFNATGDSQKAIGVFKATR